MTEYLFPGTSPTVAMLAMHRWLSDLRRQLDADGVVAGVSKARLQLSMMGRGRNNSSNNNSSSGGSQQSRSPTAAAVAAAASAPLDAAAADAGLPLAVARTQGCSPQQSSNQTAVVEAMTALLTGLKSPFKCVGLQGQQEHVCRLQAGSQSNLSRCSPPTCTRLIGPCIALSTQANGRLCCWYQTWRVAGRLC